jgi:hypothetical protein
MEGFQNRRMRHRDNVSPFVAAVYSMVLNEDGSGILSWLPDAEDGGFVIYRPHDLSHFLLPKYFRHRNYCSLIRQLNMYGFSKHENANGNTVFRNPLFRKGSPELLTRIRRRMRAGRHGSSPSNGGIRQGIGELTDVEYETLDSMHLGAVELSGNSTLLTGVMQLKEEATSLKQECGDTHRRLQRLHHRLLALLEGMETVWGKHSINLGVHSDGPATFD